MEDAFHGHALRASSLGKSKSENRGTGSSNKARKHGCSTIGDRGIIGGMLSARFYEGHLAEVG